MFKLSLAQKSSKNVYNALPLPILHMEAKFGPSNEWRTTDIQWKEIFLDHNRIHNFLPQKNEEILEELKLQPVHKKLKRYKSNWLQRVTRMNKNNFQNKPE